MNYRPPPPGMLAAADQDYHTSRDNVGRAVQLVRDLMAELPEVSSTELMAAVYASLTTVDVATVRGIAAVAVVQLAKESSA